ncbi:DUF5671 domain-containing protein [Roseivivax sp. CAU 1761]
MRAPERLQGFVAEALAAGHARPQIAGALERAGWSRAEIDAALGAWAEDALGLPVPRPRRSVSAREAFLYGLMFVALGVSVVQIVALGFALIEIWLPDPGEFAGARTGTIRNAVASLAVFFPLFFWLDARIAAAARADRGLRRSAVRDWLAHLAMFLAALTLLGDLITVLAAGLGGELTGRFALEAGLVAVVAGLVLLYFRGLVRDRGDAG